MSRVETYVSAFDPSAAAAEVVQQIEIPLIQRDYAQGRRNPRADEIRTSFLAVLHSAIAGPEPKPVSLDFVYGEIERGTLQPLDGQQRLTTLFLLHWYIAVRAGMLDKTAPWTNFSYATRQSARRFCERLVAAVPPDDAPSISEWVVDQPWYLFVWRHDPTIDAMLVMLDAIHAQFKDVDASAAWRRLNDSERPAISFHLLPLPDMGSAEDLYIKMNSRGKPLTDFENFKAHFEKTIEWSPRADEFARKIDVDWSDLLWSYRGNDDNIDDEFLRYLEFVTEVCEWDSSSLASRASRARLTDRTEAIFGAGNADRERHLDFLFSAFDVWVGHDSAALFSQTFADLPFFFRSGGVDLFEACCAYYGETRGLTRVFSFGQTLMLFAVILHLIHDSPDFSRRARILRNLIEGSQYEVRAERMSRLVAVTRDLVLDGTLPEAGLNFSYPQIDDEQAKAEFRPAHPEVVGALDALEDHRLLRGSLNAFPLDSARIASRGSAFRALIEADGLWSDAAAAFLTIGDYQRPRGRDLENPRSFQFAATSRDYPDVWRALLTGAPRPDLEPTARVFAEFLDRIHASSDSLPETLRRLKDEWLAAREAQRRFDWRYYIVKYDSMREGASGLYYSEGGEMGYSLCNLRGGKEQMNSRYRDPYLLSIYRALGEPEEIDDPWFVGYESDPRYMTLSASGVGLRCVDDGFLLRVVREGEEPTYEHRSISQVDVDGRLVDTEDRIEFGARLVSALVTRAQ